MSKYIGSQPTLAPVALPYRYRKFKDCVGRVIFDLQHDPNFVEVRLDGHPLIRGEDFSSINSNNSIKLDASVNITNAESIVEIFAYGNIQLTSQTAIDETLVRAKLSSRIPMVDITARTHLLANHGDNLNFTRNSIGRVIALSATNQYQAKESRGYDWPLVSDKGLQLFSQVENLLPIIDYTDPTFSVLRSMYNVAADAHALSTGNSVKGISTDNPLVFRHTSAIISGAKYSVFSTDAITSVVKNELITTSMCFCPGNGASKFNFQHLYLPATGSGAVALNVSVDAINETIYNVTRGVANSPNFDPLIDLTTVALKVEPIGKLGWKRISVTAKVGTPTAAGMRFIVSANNVTADTVTNGEWFYVDGMQVSRSGYPKALVTESQVRSPDIFISSSPMDTATGVSVACHISLKAVGRLGFFQTTSNFSDNRRFLFSGVLSDASESFFAYLAPATTGFETTGNVDLVVKIGKTADAMSEFRYPLAIGSDADLDITFTRKKTTATLIINGNVDAKSGLQEMTSVLSTVSIGCKGVNPDDSFGFLNGLLSHFRIWNSGV